MKLLEEVKKNSSKCLPALCYGQTGIKTKHEKYSNFYWQDARLNDEVGQGYAAFSVNPKDVDKVVDYIARQKEHHGKRSYQDECRLFFKKYKVDFDERYVWD